MAFRIRVRDGFRFRFFFQPRIIFFPRRPRRPRRPRPQVPGQTPDIAAPALPQPIPGPFPPIGTPIPGTPPFPGTGGVVIKFPDVRRIPVFGTDFGKIVFRTGGGVVNIAVILSEILNKVSRNQQEKVFREAEQAAEMEARRTGRDNPLPEIFFPDEAFPPGRLPEGDEVDAPRPEGPVLPDILPDLPGIPLPDVRPKKPKTPVLPEVQPAPRPEIRPAAPTIPRPGLPPSPAPSPGRPTVPIETIFPIQFPGFRTGTVPRREFAPAADPLPEFPIGDPLTPIRPSVPSFPGPAGFADVGPQAQPVAAAQAQQQCQVVKRRRRRKGKCREGFFKEFPGRTQFVTWREVDCVTRREKKFGRRIRVIK